MSERETAQRAEEKFDFYVISLVFTLLALSIQSASFGTSHAAAIIELVGWSLLLTSGIVGLSRLEYIPVIRLKRAMKNEFENEFYEIKKLQLQGETVINVLETGEEQDLNERLAHKQQCIGVLTPDIEQLEAHNQIKYKVFRWSFVIGLSFIVLARAYPPIMGLIYAITNT
jgi:hypothetical protein